MLYAAVGVHPTESGTWTASARNELRLLAIPHSLLLSQRERGILPSPIGGGVGGEGKVVAIGEIGLDYYWDSAPHDLQKEVLKEQLDLAAELQLPVIVHFREKSDAPDGDCTSDLMKILEEWVNRPRGRKGPLTERAGVLHSFSGTLETARAAMSLGFSIGVTGPVTFENGKKRQEIIAALPLEHLLIETDAPFQAPQPYRGKRNEPAYVCLIADKIASLHSCDVTKVATVTSENALRLFAWKESD